MSRADEVRIAVGRHWTLQDARDLGWTEYETTPDQATLRARALVDVLGISWEMVERLNGRLYFYADGASRALSDLLTAAGISRTKGEG